MGDGVVRELRRAMSERWEDVVAAGEDSRRVGMDRCEEILRRESGFEGQRSGLRAVKAELTPVGRSARIKTERRHKHIAGRGPTWWIVDVGPNERG